MSEPEAILSLVTLGVSDLQRSIAFYEALGFRHIGTLQNVGFKLGSFVDTPIMQRELSGAI